MIRYFNRKCCKYKNKRAKGAKLNLYIRHLRHGFWFSTEKALAIKNLRQSSGGRVGIVLTTLNMSSEVPGFDPRHLQIAFVRNPCTTQH